MGISVTQFRTEIVRPTLKGIGMWSPAAEELVMGTAWHESRLKWLRQVGGGPALGVMQVEPDTHNDLWEWLGWHDEIKPKFEKLGRWAGDMVTRLDYSVAIGRLVYYRRPEPLPEAENVGALAKYWKAYYNTIHGKGREMDWIQGYWAMRAMEQ